MYLDGTRRLASGSLRPCCVYPSSIKASFLHVVQDIRGIVFQTWVSSSCLCLLWSNRKSAGSKRSSSCPNYLLPFGSFMSVVYERPTSVKRLYTRTFPLRLSFRATPPSSRSRIRIGTAEDWRSNLRRRQLLPRPLLPLAPWLLFGYVILIVASILFILTLIRAGYEHFFCFLLFSVEPSGMGQNRRRLEREASCRKQPSDKKENLTAKRHTKPDTVNWEGIHSFIEEKENGRMRRILPWPCLRSYTVSSTTPSLYAKAKPPLLASQPSPHTQGRNLLTENRTHPQYIHAVRQPRICCNAYTKRVTKQTSQQIYQYVCFFNHALSCLIKSRDVQWIILPVAYIYI